MTIDDLLAENKQLRAENTELKQRLADLGDVVQDLKAQLEAALRAGKRPAAPFSKGSPKAKPKKPGRKKGHPAAHRAVPDHVDRIAFDTQRHHLRSSEVVRLRDALCAGDTCTAPQAVACGASVVTSRAPA